MTRPNIIRADTIDLQDQKFPSAQDHSRQPTHPAAIGVGPPAPHQAEALREVAAEEYEEQHRSPRMSADWALGEDSQYSTSVESARGRSQQHDHLAVAQTGGHLGMMTAEDADMADGEGDDSMDEDDMMDKISSSPSIDDEDIDFDFVYALHTFVATVEGQANATKGDTMVLLDDSNSYWWLVRVAKDSSIGYLPAEHIETPTERLARLNKHRNIDLTAAMLGDTMEKSKNPLKKAIRRRNAKTVTFGGDSYVEASDVDYSSTEDEEGDSIEPLDEAQAADVAKDEPAVANTISEKAAIRDGRPSDEASRPVDGIKTSSEVTRNSDEIFEGSSGKSRNGTVRNTDSFFKDDTVETKKITLTPNILRDDSITSTRTSNDSKEHKTSFEKPEKELVEKKEDKKKKDKKEKEKKPGMLSGLFKRKDKKSPMAKEEADELIYGKRGPPEEARTSPVSSKDSAEYMHADEPLTRTTSNPPPQVNKLQKQVRPEPAKAAISTEAETDNSKQVPAPERAAPVAGAVDATMRLVQDDDSAAGLSNPAIRARTPESTRAPAAVQSNVDEQKTGSTFSKILRARSGSNSDPKPEKLKKATERLDLDSSPELSPVQEIAKDPLATPLSRPIPGAFPDSYMGTRVQDTIERLSESPVQVSPIEQLNPPLLMVDTSSQEEPPSPVSSASPDIVDKDELHASRDSGLTSTTQTSGLTWNDAHLRTFFDDDSDVKDLLMVVYDKTGVEPAGPDHPITGNLFKAENAKLAEITSRLDNMLGDWLARKTAGR